MIKALAMLILGVLPLFGIVAAIRVWLFLRNGVRVTAKVVGHKFVKLRPDSSTSSETEDQYLPIITFHDHNGIYREVTLSTERPLKMKGVRDDEVRIIYPKDNPKKAKMDYWATLWMVPMFLLGPAALLAAAIVWLYVISFWGS
jgi:hypothetical protein